MAHTEEVQTEIFQDLQDCELSNSDDDSKYRGNSCERSSIETPSCNLQNADTNTSDDENVAKIKKKRLKRFSASDSDMDGESLINKVPSDSENDIDTNRDVIISQSVPNKLRIRTISKTSESGSNSDGPGTIKNEGQQIRMKNKRNKLRDKFKSLVTSRAKEEPQLDKNNTSSENMNAEGSDDCNDEIFSIEHIKQKIKERMSFKPSICDPDTSDEEATEVNQQKQILNKKKQKKSTILTSPKPMRMSAKQAMENMQKIKSESNRMLREKEVSLPYHRPKALSLKDIMSRRKPAVAADGKALPIKMNADQLTQYSLQLEQRQKDIMELCKSDTEDENDNPKEDRDNCEEPSNINDNLTDINDSVYDSAINNDKNNTQATITECDILLEDTPKESNDLVNKENIFNSISLHDQASKSDNNNINITEESPAIDTELVEIHNDNEDSAYVNNVEELSKETPNLVMEEGHSSKAGTEVHSQLISLHYDSEKVNICQDQSENLNVRNINEKDKSDEELVENGFSDEDINIEDIEKIIENAEVVRNVANIENVNSPSLIKDSQPLNIKPKLTGGPGMVIDLDAGDPVVSKRLSGIELLKERFTYFAKLKSPEEFERDRETKIKPGTQHLKLKQELEEKIAEQRSLEWAKRLEEERQQQIDLKALRGDDSDAEDDIEKIEAKLEENVIKKDESSEEEQEEEMDEVDDKPRKKNPLLADEADESDCDEKAIDDVVADGDNNTVSDEDNTDVNESSQDSSDDESSESEDEQPNRVKKGRILKAFEDSDDEDSNRIEQINVNNLAEKEYVTAMAKEATIKSGDEEVNSQIDSPLIKDTQDEVIQLAQRHQSASDDLFTSQESHLIASEVNLEEKDKEEELGTQTFSILNAHSTAEISATPGSQILDDSLGALNSGRFSQNRVPPSQIPATLLSQSQSQPIGEDILALCTGNFYDNQFISPSGHNDDNRITQDNIDDFDEDLSRDPSQGLSIKLTSNANEKSKLVNQCSEVQVRVGTNGNVEEADSELRKEDGNLLKSILEELHDPEFDSQKPNKYFLSNKIQKNSVELKKKFIIDSDDETKDANGDEKKTKKLKKRKPEKRALQISDDEEDEQMEEEVEEYPSDIEDETERIVEYDSEENEVVVKAQNLKKKRKATDFFEQEAELTSEDEWVGSGDEDEAGLDRMEREEGDDDTFHQGKLQSELGQIHIRDVLDQDKREVRIIQELLFEDGDLGDGHRQRKFRWRNADGEEETGTILDEFGDTQEEEFESEEQWRKQRHEREVFLRQMQNETEDSLNVTVNRKSIIKANLCSKSMSSLLMEVNTSSKEEKTETPVVEKKTVKDIPSTTAFTIYQQNFHGSLLTRGRGALARLAALATPLATDDDAPKVGSSVSTSSRNFVFAAVARDDSEAKIAKKRKADVGTPRLVKKLKIDEKRTFSRNSLLDHLKAQ